MKKLGIPNKLNVQVQDSGQYESRKKVFLERFQQHMSMKSEGLDGQAIEYYTYRLLSMANIVMQCIPYGFEAEIVGDAVYSEGSYEIRLLYKERVVWSFGEAYKRLKDVPKQKTGGRPYEIAWTQVCTILHLSQIREEYDYRHSSYTVLHMAVC